MHKYVQALAAADTPLKVAGISTLFALIAGIIFLFVSVKVMGSSSNKNYQLKDSGRVGGHLIFGLVLFAIGIMLLVGTISAAFMTGTVQSIIG